MSADVKLRDQVVAELNSEPRINAAHVGVTAHDGLVTLTGHVSSYFEKHAAEKAAGRVKSVKAVAEEMTVDIPFSAKRSDEDIASAPLTRLTWNSFPPQDAIKVKVEKGWVTLTGDVDVHFQRVSAEFDIACLHGVVGLTNKTRIKLFVNVADVSQEIRNALARSWFSTPSSVEVSVPDGKICLAGTVQTLQDRKLATAIAWAAPGVTSVEDAMSLA
jgi:osmotically-inducible protein OsmY